ncbi:homoserine dehydrogenase [Bacillus sp. B15-48]|uniref:homoserine dehydrogenase n=1 Tax=Bacillus sp. B15-48 TaxID=1548601 RepID=UPI00193F1DF9|nr:homoserine dehydrogenase [Bacillus sp. B15-48]MBM4765068.1 homoserine dehydrogenase [Bacillus sp. B15-48]
MSTIKVAILGFGTVGEGVYRTISTHQEKLTAVLGKKVEVAAILLKDKTKERGIDGSVLVTDDIEDIIGLEQLDVVVEAIVGREPANTYLRRLLQKGCHVVTANKEMFAYHGTELEKLAAEQNVSIGFEATVAGGIPVIQTIQQLLNINRIKKIEGILNGTSNYILSEMRTNGLSFDAALKAAQAKGYAEADPTNDIEGYDAFYKLLIVSELAFGEKPEWESVHRQGIANMSIEEIKIAEELGLRFKLIASVQVNDGKVIGSVRPTLVSKTHPFFNIEGVENAVSIEGDIVGRISLQGPGAGMFPTASAIIEDLVHVVHGIKAKKVAERSPLSFVNNEVEKSKQTWLIINPGKGPLKTNLFTNIENKVIIEADEQTILNVQKQNKEARFYQIVGEYEVTEKNDENFPHKEPKSLTFETV